MLLANELKSTDGIVDAGISSDSITIWWRLPNGIEYCLLTETKASLTDTFNKSLDMSYFKKNENVIYRISGFPHNNNALILSPYQWNWNLFGLIPLQDETTLKISFQMLDIILLSR